MKYIIALWLAAGVAHGATLWWGPYLQDVSTDHASILWATRGDDGAAVLTYRSGTVGARTAVVKVTALGPSVSQLPETAWLQKVELRDLTPGTIYTYALQLDGKPVAVGRTMTFQTAGRGPFRFLVLGDSGDNGLPQQALAAALEKEQAAILLHVGDIAYFEGLFQQYTDYFFAIYPGLLARTPLATAPGNHDYVFGGLAYKTLFARQATYYSWDWGNVHFVALDTNTPLEEANARGAMLAWLEQDLRETKQTWRVVYFHHPPFPSTEGKLNDPNCALALQYIAPVLERQAVHLVLSGHEHIYQRTKPRLGGVFQASGPGTVYVTTGGGGSQLYNPGTADFIASARAGSHYLRFDADETTLKWEVVGPAGEILDRATISAAPAVLDPPVLDSATFSVRVAPGTLVSLFGWNLASADDTPETAQVFVNGLPAPLVFASRMQLNVQLPFDVAGSAELEVRSHTGTAKKAFATSPVAPAIFLIPDGGTQVAAAVHLDGRLVTRANPAMAGEWLAVYLTGLGAVKGGIAAGQRAPLAPLYETVAGVRAQVGGTEAEVSIACLAPGFFGLYQVNLRVPGGAGVGVTPIRIIGAGVGSTPASLPLGGQKADSPFPE